MSISSGNIGLIQIAINNLGGDFRGKIVAELGNQKILAKGKNGKDYKKCIAKEWFTNLGSEHISFDMNGKDGAIALDLCKAIPDKFVGLFDLLTNYGTSEHVEKQKVVFENIHNMVRVGGCMVHSVPMDGHWESHCPYHYTEDFPMKLAQLNEYELLHEAIQDRNNNKLVNFVLRKKESNPFVGIPQGTITVSKNYKKNTDNLF